MISVETRKVYFARTKGRAYLSKSGAIHGETMAILRKKYKPEKFEHDTGHSFQVECMEGFEKMYRRMKRIVSKSIN